MAEYAFFLQKVDWWRKDMALLLGDISICPMLHQFQLPCHSQTELSSLNGLKVWGEGQKPNHDIAFLLVRAEEATGDRNYGLSIIWVNPGQVRVPSMEEAVGKLTTCTSSRTYWPYTLVQLHKGTCHAPLPKEGHLGVLPQTGAEVTLCRWISQLEICQLLVAGPQVIYPIGMNGHNELVITSLPEPLASSISLTTGKPVYLGIDIPPPPVEEPDQKVLPLGKVSTIMIGSPHKSPQKSEGEGSITMEVRNLLSWAILKMSGCGSENSTPRRPNTVIVPMTLPQESKELLQPVDTSCQVSAEMAEASLEGIPTSISSINMVSRPESITPPVDPWSLGKCQKSPQRAADHQSIHKCPKAEPFGN